MSDLTLHRISRPPATRGYSLVAFALGVGFWALVSWITVAEYHTLNSTSRDMAVYVQLVWNTANGNPFYTTLLEHNRLHLAEHLALLIPLVAPLYRLWPDPRFLLGLQQAALALSGLPVFLWARHLLGPRAAVLVLAAYYAMPTLTEVALDAFYPIAFTALPLGLATYLGLLGRPRSACLLGLATLPLEEESALVAVGLGVFLAVYRRPRVWGIALSAASVLWLVVAAMVVMPRFHDPSTIERGSNRTVQHFQQLRENPSGVLAALAERRVPLAVEWLLVPTGTLALLSPQILAIDLPHAVTLLLADREGRYRRHWAAPMLPIIWLAAASGLARLPSGLMRMIGALAIAVGTLLSFARDSALPGGGTYEPDDVVGSPRAEQLSRLLAEIPPDAPVAASRRVLTNLANRPHLYVYPPNYAGVLWPAEPPPRYWLFDLSNDQTQEGLSGRSSPLRTGSGGVIWTAGEHAALFAPTPLPVLERGGGSAFEWVRLTAWEVRPTSEAWELLLAWEADRRPARPQVRTLQLRDASGQVIGRIEHNPLDQMFPTTDWPRGQVWIDRTLLPKGSPGVAIEATWSERGRAATGFQEIGHLP